MKRREVLRREVLRRDVLHNNTAKIGWSLLLFLVFVGESWAMQSIKMNLESITKKAGRIVEGVVLSASEGSVIVPGGQSVPVTKYTLSVFQSLKGQTGQTVVVKQVRLGASSGMAGAGLPGYKVGEHLILFLTAESPLGLSAPVGLMQGVFQVQKDEKGAPNSVINGTNNAGLFDGMAGLSVPLQAPSQAMKKSGNSAKASDVSEDANHAGGSAPYSQFISVVKTIVK